MVSKVIFAEPNMEGSGLTIKQAEVLNFVRDHRTNKEIALLLGISPSAVEQRLQSVRRKFGVHSRADLARAYDRAQSACVNLTGVEYQVDQSIPDSHNFIQHSNEDFAVLDFQSEPTPENFSEKVSDAKVAKVKSPVLEAVDRASGVAGRIAVITTAAASIAFLVLLIAGVAPALQRI